MDDVLAPPSEHDGCDASGVPSTNLRPAVLLDSIQRGCLVVGGTATLTTLKTTCAQVRDALQRVCLLQVLNGVSVWGGAGNTWTAYGTLGVVCTACSGGCRRAQLARILNPHRSCGARHATLVCEHPGRAEVHVRRSCGRYQTCTHMTVRSAECTLRTNHPLLALHLSPPPRRVSIGAQPGNAGGQCGHRIPHLGHEPTASCHRCVPGGSRSQR